MSKEQEDTGFNKGDRVLVTDFPFGRPINVAGIIVGVLGKDYYNVLIEKGLQEGKIIKYKFWNLIKEERGIGQQGD